MKSTLTLGLFLLLTTTSWAQSPPASPCLTQTEYRQFDFWVGEWEVKNPNGQVVGESKIVLILGDCVVFENWTSASPGYIGKSMNYYDLNDQQWHQKWIDNQGIPIEFSGKYHADTKSMNYKGTGVGTNGEKVDFKLTFYHLTDDHVRQHWEQSTDGGQTWATIFDGHYRRKKAD